MDRKTWEEIPNLGEGETYKHTIDPKKSELYGGEEVVYEGPFLGCDRVGEYKLAWEYFARLFNDKNKI